MRASRPVLALLLLASTASAAPAPDLGREPKAKLEALKKRLPAILKQWMEDRGSVLSVADDTYAPEVRLLRCISPSQAKAGILFAATWRGTRRPPGDVLLTVYLTYHDGAWTTGRFELVPGFCREKDIRGPFSFLMLAIDEAAEK